jgi:hypothetical protein
MISFSQLARAMYAGYRLAALGQNVKGEQPLPTWKELTSTQQERWLAAAKTAAVELQTIH